MRVALHTKTDHKIESSGSKNPLNDLEFKLEVRSGKIHLLRRRVAMHTNKDLKIEFGGSKSVKII